MSLSFSIITPSYNQGQFIERTILSVLQQSDVEYEYRVQDGGSSDLTLDILRKYQDKIQWVSEKDEGQADAVNRGILASTGDIIAWLNSDDVYYPSALKKVGHIFEAYPNVQVVYGRAHHIDQNDNVIDSYPTEKWNFSRLKEICFICQPATFFRRQLVETHGALDSQLKFCMDYELWLRYGQHTQFFFLPEVLAGSRLYATNKTLGQRVAVHHEINDMMKKKFGISPEKWVIAYASVLIKEQEKSEYKTSGRLKIYARQVSEFYTEAFRSYCRWRDLKVTPRTFWRIFRWTAASLYHQFRPKPRNHSL